MPQYEPHKAPLAGLLNTGNQQRLSVPDYQRDFSWDVEQAATLWDDLLNFSEEHPGERLKGQVYFLGTTVVVAKPDTHELLDGQQRLATSTILLSVMRDFLQLHYPEAAASLSQDRIKKHDYATNTTVYALRLNVYDRDFFRLTFQDTPPIPRNAERESHRRMLKVKKFFVDQFQKQYNTLSTESFHAWIFRLQEVLLHNFTVISVHSDDDEKASDIFETLNDRGIGLSTPDLVRNLLLRRAREEERSEIVDAWGDASELERPATLEDLLRYYWVTRYGDVKKGRLFREIKKGVIEDGLSSLEMSRNLRDAAELYRYITDARDEDPDVEWVLHASKELGAKALYPAFLASYSLDQGARRRLTRSLFVLFVRHTLVGGLSNSPLESFVYALAKDIRDGQKPLRNVVEEIRSFAPSDEEFGSSFRRFQASKLAYARILLTELEADMRGVSELEVAGSKRVHVDHIYPQSPLAGEAWPEHERWINRLGNLTLLHRQLNTGARNALFSRKRDDFYAKSDLRLNQELAALDEWSPTAIDERQNHFADRAAKIWSLR